MDLFNTIVCIAAHPDDIELGMGGTISLLRRKKKNIFFIINYIPIDNNTSGTTEERISEVKKSLDIFNIPHDNLIINNFYKKNTREKVYMLDNQIKKINPDAIFTHYQYDIHQEHNDVFKITNICCRNKPISLFMWENNLIGGLLQKQFQTNFLIKLEKVDIENKIKSWKQHKTQYRKYKSFDNLIYSKSNIWGFFCKSDNSEAFRSLKIFI